MNARLFTSALFAGLVAGLIAALLQFLLMENLILEAEEYESGARTHFAGVPSAADQTIATTAAHDHATHEHEEPAGNGLLHRFSLAFGADFVVYVAWGLIMVAGFAIAEQLGKRVSRSDALLWGLAGFVAVNLAPGVGLPPELPGIPAADLNARQVWWILTVISSGAAMALFGYGRNPIAVLLGAALLVAPHVIGAPRLDGYAGTAPPELAGEYVARSYAVAFAAWLSLGVAAGYFWNRSTVRDGQTQPA